MALHAMCRYRLHPSPDWHRPEVGVLALCRLLREYFELEFGTLKLPFLFDLERVIDDYVLLCMLVGNDFLPGKAPSSVLCVFRCCSVCFEVLRGMSLPIKARPVASGIAIGIRMAMIRFDWDCALAGGLLSVMQRCRRWTLRRARSTSLWSSTRSCFPVWADT
jgi:hypothetical protein